MALLGWWDFPPSSLPTPTEVVLLLLPAPGVCRVVFWWELLGVVELLALLVAAVVVMVVVVVVVV